MKPATSDRYSDPATIAEATATAAHGAAGATKVTTRRAGVDHRAATTTPTAATATAAATNAAAPNTWDIVYTLAANTTLTVQAHRSRSQSLRHDQR